MNKKVQVPFSYKEWLKYEADMDIIYNIFYDTEGHDPVGSELDSLLAELYKEYKEDF